jgi:hypothetical protein
MNWTHFLLSLTGIYLCYYMLNFLYDMYLSKQVPSAQHEQELLFFSGDIEPELITYEGSTETVPATTVAAQTRQSVAESPGSIPSTPLEFTGAVNLKELFRLAQQDLIEYTGAISY